MVFIQVTTRCARLVDCTSLMSEVCVCGAQIVLELVALLDSRGSVEDWRHAVRVLAHALATLERYTNLWSCM
jgi:hypothetical protein